MGEPIFNRAPDAEVVVPEGAWMNRYQRYGNVWFYVSDLERRIVPAGEHWLLHHIERLTAPLPAPAGTAGVEAAIVPVQLGKPVFEFASHAQWENKAQSWFSRHALTSHNSLCLDTRNRPCISGREFKRAHEEGAFPVRVYSLTAAALAASTRTTGGEDA